MQDPSVAQSQKLADGSSIESVIARKAGPELGRKRGPPPLASNLAENVVVEATHDGWNTVSDTTS